MNKIHLLCQLMDEGRKFWNDSFQSFDALIQTSNFFSACACAYFWWVNRSAVVTQHWSQVVHGFGGGGRIADAAVPFEEGHFQGLRVENSGAGGADVVAAEVDVHNSVCAGEQVSVQGGDLVAVDNQNVDVREGKQVERRQSAQLAEDPFEGRHGGEEILEPVRNLLVAALVVDAQAFHQRVVEARKMVAANALDVPFRSDSNNRSGASVAGVWAEPVLVSKDALEVTGCRSEALVAEVIVKLFECHFSAGNVVDARVSLEVGSLEAEAAENAGLDVVQLVPSEVDMRDVCVVWEKIGGDLENEVAVNRQDSEIGELGQVGAGERCEGSEDPLEGFDVSEELFKVWRDCCKQRLIVDAHACDLCISVCSNVVSRYCQDGRIISGDAETASASVEGRFGKPILVAESALKGRGLRVSEAA